MKKSRKKSEGLRNSKEREQRSKDCFSTLNPLHVRSCRKITGAENLKFEKIRRSLTIVDYC